MIRGMLDLSIPNAIKEINTEEKAKKFLLKEYDISEKVDGIKINVFRKSGKFDRDNIFSNFVFSYKKTVLYYEDFPRFGNFRALAKNESIGDAQFVFIFDLFETAHRQHRLLEMLPQNTEFFFEYVVKKPTLTREYENLHHLILLGYAKSSVTERFGYVTSYPEQMKTESVQEYAAIIGCDTPRTLFKKYKHEMTDSTSLENLNMFRKYLLQINSVYGGKIEGVVLNDGEYLYKFVQDDQYDKEYRCSLKMKYEMEKEKENEYFLQVKKESEDILSMFRLDMTTDILSILSNYIYNSSLKFPFHEKKTEFQKREDFYHVIKYLYIRKMKENDNALFIGRLQPPTLMHMQIIGDALKCSANVCVAIVKGKKSDPLANPFTFELQRRIINEAFPDVEVIEVSTGNIITAINSSTLVITKVLCGSDRLETYRTQLLNNPELEIIEMKRDNEVSGTKVREAIKRGDRKTLEENMHSTSHKFFKDLQKGLRNTIFKNTTL